MDCPTSGVGENFQFAVNSIGCCGQSQSSNGSVWEGLCSGLDLHLKGEGNLW